MKKIGLTGGIGSGKSFVAQVFAHLGIPVYDSDNQAKFLMNNSALIIKEISSLFGPKAYKKGILDRKYIADIVFSAPDKLARLNQIVHPAVAEDFECWHQMQKKQAPPFVIKEAAILFESGAYKSMDSCILVIAPLELRISRIVKRDHLSDYDIRKRMQNQLSTEKLKSLADYIIDNDGKKLILPQVINIIQKNIQ